MKKKIKVGILFGGKSAEHEISLISAQNVIQALDKNKYEPVLIGIDQSGHWLSPQASQALMAGVGRVSAQRVVMAPETRGLIVSQERKGATHHVDVIFPILHGPLGEDGTVQGLLKLADVPFVGAGVLGSAVNMDKDVMKRLLRDAGIPVPKFLVFHDNEKKSIAFSHIAKTMKLPFFVKPVNMGSSIGMSKVHNSKEFAPAVRHAFEFDRKIIIEEAIVGREIECSVLGNEDPRASVPGEIIPYHEFYSYEAKYLDENGAGLDVPAKLPQAIVKRIQALAVQAFKVLECEGMARVDMFLTKQGKLYINELNTIPGFTKISMYPKLWEASGISYSRLIDMLIRLAIERHHKENKLKTKR